MSFHVSVNPTNPNEKSLRLNFANSGHHVCPLGNVTGHKSIGQCAGHKSQVKGQRGRDVTGIKALLEQHKSN